MKDAQGYPLTTSSQEAARLYSVAQQNLLEYRLVTMQSVKDAIAADPHFTMAHCLRGYQFMMYGSFSVLNNAKSALRLADAHAAGTTERERMHVEALRSWTEGRTGKAILIWEQLLSAYPLDIVALRMHHFNCFWTGRQHSLRGGAASVLEHWTEDLPGYGNVLGMLAFGYEECGQYREAEKFGRIAVRHNPQDLWALHAVAHVLEMEDRQQEGIAWLTRPEDHWSDRNPFKGHLWWHLALFHLESGQHDQALALYDRSVRNDGSTFYLDIQNAASLLARLELLGVDVGDRWVALADFAEKSIGDHGLIFTDLHYMMALAKERRFDAAERLLLSMEEFAAQDAADSAAVVRTLGLPLCRGILRFEQGDYAAAVEQFAPLHNNDAPLGASHAQRDIVDQYLIEATLRARNLERTRMLLAERVTLRPRNRTALQRHKDVSRRIYGTG
ncbi:tetratricopeptide repeat protein [Pseudoroseomonas globiformis]|uniref:Tetratricopeptide repeat protein 38 n=1 Tax=Teichococcus globiformis TaxID=2307229 RepID=A0ABV7G749_9PROT